MAIKFNPLSGNFDIDTDDHEQLKTLQGGIANNHAHYINFPTVAAAGSATATVGQFCYIEEKEALYRYCLCSAAADGDLVLTTGSGSHRWTMMQKVSRTQGDTGWINTDNAVLTELNSTTIRLALTGIGQISIRSIRYDVPIGNYDFVVSGPAGEKFVYFDDATLTLKSQNSFWDFQTQVPVALVFWSGTAILGVYTEFHGIRDTVWHAWAHLYFGSQYRTGLAATGLVQPDNNTNPNLDTVQYLWFTPGVIQDEDTTITVGSGNWTQTLGSGLTSADAAIIPFYYFNGTQVVPLAAMADRTPFIHAGGNTAPQWNNGGTLQAAVSGNYVVYHYFASPYINNRAVFARPHNAVFTSLITAQAARPNSLTWNEYNEVKHLYTAVFRVNTAWAPVPSHGCKIVSLQDFRTVAGSPANAVSPTSHSSLSGLTAPNAHPASSINVDFTKFRGNYLKYQDIEVQQALEDIDKGYEIDNLIKNPRAATDLLGSTTPHDVNTIAAEAGKTLMTVTVVGAGQAILGLQSFKLTGVVGNNGVAYWDLDSFDTFRVGKPIFVNGICRPISGYSAGNITFSIYNSTDAVDVAGTEVPVPNADHNFSMEFTPVAGKTYKLKAAQSGGGAIDLLLVDDLCVVKEQYPQGGDGQAKSWVASNCYLSNALVNYNGAYYRCVTQNNDAVFDSTKWELVTDARANREEITQTAHGFVAADVGRPVYLNGANYAFTDADVEATSEAVALISRYIDANKIEVTTNGRVNGIGTNAFESGSLPSIGAKLWLSTTTGKLHTSAPVTFGQYEVFVGYIARSGGGTCDVLFAPRKMSTVGSSITQNFVKNPDAELSATSNVESVDIVTVAAETSSPILGTRSFKLETNGNPQGRYIWRTKAIDSFYAGKGLQFAIKTRSVSGYAAGDFQAVVYEFASDNPTSATALEYTAQDIPVGDYQVKLNFIVESGKYYYPVVREKSGATAGRLLIVDDVKITDEKLPMASGQTDWISFTPTGSWTTNTTYTGRYKIIGDTAFYRISLNLSGAPTAALLSINLPFTINTTKLSLNNATIDILGVATIHDNGTTVYSGTVNYLNSTTVRVYVHKTLTGTNPVGVTTANVLSNTDPMTFAANDQIDLIFSTPIVGYSSNITLTDRATEEYASHDGSNVVVGPSGAIMPLTDLTDVVAYTITSGFTNIQPTDCFIFELQAGGVGAWVPQIFGIDTLQFNTGTTTSYGAGVDTTGSAVRLLRGRYARGTTAWSAAGISANTRWRVRKVSQGALTGVGPLESRYIKGVTDGSTPQKGFLGEVISATIGNTTFAVIDTTYTLASLALTEGTYIVSGNIYCSTAGTTRARVRGFITTSAVETASKYTGSHVSNDNIYDLQVTIPSRTITIPSGGGTVYIRGLASFTGTAPTTTGSAMFLEATRIA